MVQWAVEEISESHSLTVKRLATESLYTLEEFWH